MTTPLVLLHGFTGSPASWDEVVRRLAGEEILRPTLLGHGTTAAGAATFTEEVARLVRLLPEGRPLRLAGYSLGARLALGIALEQPARVTQLTLIGVNAGLSDDAERAARRASDEALARLLETAGIEAFVRHWEAQPLFATQHELDPALRARKRAERLAHDPNELACCLRVLGLAGMPDYTPRLSSLTMPVSFLAGERDSKFAALARNLAHAVPGARLAIIPGAGHDLLLERPDLVAVALSAKEAKP